MRATLPALAVAVLAAQGCASSAPYTAASMAINGGLALGVAAATRAEGGCWAICTGGLACNPVSGWCEKPPPGAAPGCPPGATDPRCAWPAPTIRQELPGPAAPAGISPATGGAPPPPSEASPGGPPRP